MKLSELLRDVPVKRVDGDRETDICAVTSDSRLVVRGSLFVAIPGLQADGVRFAGSAVEKGAAAVIAQEPLALAVPTVLVDDARAALALVAANFYGRPSDSLVLIGVTGTSGKTTTAKMVEAVFDATGEPAGLIGTIEYRAGEERLSADRTTPDAVVLQEWLAKMVEARVSRAVMEVSSHALALKRTHGIRFAAAVFTNLSRDHFDFHKDFEDYFAAKRMLFDQIDRSTRSAVTNIDDEYGRRVADYVGSAGVTFGRSAPADIHPEPGFTVDVRGLHGIVKTPWGDVRIDSELLGLPNLYNWMGAIGAAMLVGVPREAVEAGVRSLRSVRGRFERVGTDGGPTVIVDYAHKPDALDKLLRAVRDLAEGRRIVLLFGCGGDRDKGKRPEMARIASDLADFTVLTSDNPRSEPAEAILDQIEGGMTTRAYARQPDRREAIAEAIAKASGDDVIVIAGKGHESYQVIGDQVIHFDDREEAELALKKRAQKTVPKSVSN